MNKHNLKEMILSSLSTFFALGMAVILYFFLLRYQNLSSFFQRILKILTPFVYGGILAFLLKSPCSKLERFLQSHLPAKMKKSAKAISVFGIILFSLLLIYLLLAMVIPEVVQSLSVIIASIPKDTKVLTEWLNHLISEDHSLYPFLTEMIQDGALRLQTWAQSDLLPFLQSLMGEFASRVNSIIGVVSNIILGIIVAIYLLLERKTLSRQGKALLYALLPEAGANWVMEELQFVDKVFTGFFVGKIVDSAIVGLICYVFCFALSLFTDFPNAMLISLIIGVTNVIPYFGPFIGAIPSALLILMASPSNCVIFVIFIIILQQFDGNILGPRLLASSVGIGGLWVLFSITIFGGLFGFAGILVGVPVFAIIFDLIRRFTVRRLKKKQRTMLLKEQPSEE